MRPEKESNNQIQQSGGLLGAGVLPVMRYIFESGWDFFQIGYSLFAPDVIYYAHLNVYSVGWPMRKEGSGLLKTLRGLCGLLIALAIVLSVSAPAFAVESTELPVPEERIAETEAHLSEDPEEVPETLPVLDSEDPEAIPTEIPEDGAVSGPDASGEETAANREFPLYFQTDYPNVRFGSGTIASSGCSITSVAMVATYLTGHAYLPDELARYFGGYGENNIQRLEYASEQLRLPYRKAENIHDVMKALEAGNVAILLMNHLSIFTDSQHFIVLKGLNDDGKIMVYDSYEPNYELWNLKRAFVEGFELNDILLGYSGGWIYDVSAVPEDPFIYEEEDVAAEPRYTGVELTWEEQQLLAKLIWLEARGESEEGQQAVAEVVLNRLVSGRYGSTISEVIRAEGQFRSVPFLKDAEAWQAQYDAIDRALRGPNVLPIDVVHFATYAENENVWGQIGGHIFCYAA